ncbi:MAG TPA: hypothetical protein VHU87_01705 [Rhizomicrobium sp.]|jgi:hypothetical protein|nr:hypothetical protein [Rhizomicrobium sp.]
MNKTILTGLLAGATALLPLAALAGDLGGEIATAAQHAELSAAASDLGGTHMHLHHTLNCLVGPDGEGFDSAELNPCANSGNGAIPDAQPNVAKVRQLNLAADQARAGIATRDKAAAQQDATDAAATLKAIH